MTNEAEIYSQGFSDGLAAQQSLVKSDLQVLGLANALDALALHCANLPRFHESCIECQTALLLGRVVNMGNHMRERSL